MSAEKAKLDRAIQEAFQATYPDGVVVDYVVQVYGQNVSDQQAGYARWTPTAQPDHRTVGLLDYAAAMVRRGQARR